MDGKRIMDQLDNMDLDLVEKPLGQVFQEKLQEIEEHLDQKPICFSSSSLLGAEDFKEEYCQELINWVGKGRTLKSFLGRIGATRKVFDTWCESFPDLKSALEISEAISLGHFEQLAKMQALGVIRGNQTMLWNLMKNRHPEEFKDKVEFSHSGEMIFNFDTGVKREDIEIESEDFNFKEIPDRVEVVDPESTGSELL